MPLDFRLKTSARSVLYHMTGHKKVMIKSRSLIKLQARSEIICQMRNPNRKEEEKLKMSGSSYCINRSGIYFDTVEILSVVSKALPSEVIGGPDSDTGSHRSKRPQCD
jgi:hypothetical protein